MGFKINSSIRVDGEDYIERKLKEFFIDTQDSGQAALGDAAELLKEDARKRVPVSKSGRRYGKWKHPPGTLRDSIAVGFPMKKKAGRIGIKVGIEKNKYFTGDDRFYARFVEFGTEKMLAQPFMRPTLVRNRAKVRKLVMDRLKKELGL